jgi:glyoxylase-like metal-dependent hydrolase (beta-lactamase superfamily II)
MQVTKHIHALRVPFKVPLSPERIIDRFVYSYLVFADKITLVDSGVKGAENLIFDYIEKSGGDPKNIAAIILSHSHPDHVGSAKAIKEATGCQVLAHSGEQDWIEDTEKQLRDRPVPGFNNLVGGPVAIDRLLKNGEILDFGQNIRCEIIHTPGHSRGSISLFFNSEKAIFTGDSLPVPNDLPIYDDVAASVDSIRKLRNLKDIEVLLSSWDAPIKGRSDIDRRIDESLAYLRRIHDAVLKWSGQGNEDLMELCRLVVSELGLPPLAANPLVARSIAANLAALSRVDL